jgi:hypothetical protein
MKRTVWTFGLISGGISSAFMMGLVPFADAIGFDRSLFIGYTIIVLAGLFIFFGVRSYREQAGGGRITFARAFGVGILITLISCVCYVVTWEIVYFTMLPDFTDKYAAYTIEKLRASGAPAQTIEATTRQMEQFKEMYKNPLINSAMTFAEPFPVHLGITLISAAVLRKK